MRPLLTPWRLLAAFLLLLLVLLGVAAQQFRLFERGLFILQEWRHASEWRERSIWLPDYRVDIEARPIEGLVDDVSALTYDPDRHSLFTVTNQRPEIIELSLDGHLIRRIPLRAMGRELRGRGFVRIHRSRLVRRDRIALVRPHDVILVDGTSLKTGKRYRSALID